MEPGTEERPDRGALSRQQLILSDSRGGPHVNTREREAGRGLKGRAATRLLTVHTQDVSQEFKSGLNDTEQEACSVACAVETEVRCLQGRLGHI